MRPHGHARISRSAPQAQGLCDRCQFNFPHKDLQWQFQWSGARLQNLRILVCPSCRDVPQEGLRTIVFPPDPMPIANPRPEAFPQADSPISGLGWDPANLFSNSGPTAQSAFFGNLIGGGGPDAVFYGATNKTAGQSATLTPSSTTSYVGINWSATAGAPASISPSSIGAQTQSYSISGATIAAPIDAAFLGSNLSTTVGVQGSNDNATWTTVFSHATAGTKGETVTAASSQFTSAAFFAYHRITIAGDGVHQAALAYAALTTSGPSGAQTGSELGA